MKIHELAQACASRPPVNAEVVGDDEFEGEDETESIDDQLTTALIQLEECWALLDGLHDHFSKPRAKMTTYFRREIKRVSIESAAFLADYTLEG